MTTEHVHEGSALRVCVLCVCMCVFFLRANTPSMTANPLPQGVTVYVCCEDGPRRHITCFRCGEYGHFRGECHTFKTQMCAKHALGECTADACPFAHSADELRKPWLPKCVRVVKAMGAVQVLGCGQTGHTFRTCPHRYHHPYPPPHRSPQSVDTTHSTSLSNRMQ